MAPKPNIFKSSMGDSPTDRMKADSRVPRGFAPGNVLAERYVVMSKLGEGGMGVVYKCFDKLGGVEVAVKGLPPEVSRNEYEMEEIRANYQIVSNLHHQNIAGSRTLEKDEETGDYYLVMDLASGIDLRRWIQGNPLASTEAKLSILRQVAAALDYAHSEGVIHRDVKPENVMVDAEGRVKVLDFGLAARICSCQSSIGDAVTSRGGSPGYKSPEQWQGRQQGAEADVYAFGVMAYWMFAGELPFDGDDMDVLRQAVLSASVRLIEGLPAHMNQALAKALAKKPEDRYSSCGEVVEALSAPPPSQSHRSSWPMVLLAIVTMIAVAVAGARWFNAAATDHEVSVPVPEPAPPEPAPPEPTPPKPAPPPEPKSPSWTTTTTNSACLNRPCLVMTSPDKTELRLMWCGEVGDTANGFWMGETEVTEGQWRSVMGTNTIVLGDDYPKTRVSLDDCRNFMERLRNLTGLDVSLPGTNIWVVACLAGSTTSYWWGNGPENSSGKSGGHFGRKSVNVVGGKDGKKTYPPNGWGLYDMHGNVAEWCDGGFIFGGGYQDNSAKCKASGYEAAPDFGGDDNTGFRVFVNGGKSK